MSPDAVTPPPQIDSVIDRAQMRAELAAFRRELEVHVQADQHMQREIIEKLDGLLKTRTQVRTLLTVLVFAAGGLLVGGRWVVSSAVRDALIDNGVVELKPRGAP